SVLRRARERQPGAIALHYDLAGVQEPAFRYALKAATLSDRIHAPAETEFFLRMAAANATSEAERFVVEERLGRFLHRNRRFREADRLLTSVVAKSRAAGNLRTWISAEIDRLAERSRLGLASAPDLIGKLRQLATQAESL